MPIIRVTHPDISNLLPSQLGQPGEYLRTDGTSVSWEPADALPTQTGNANKFLKTDGTTSSWDTVDHTHSHADELPSQTGQAGEFLQTDGTTATWEPVTHPEELPTQTGQAGEFLQTDGTTATWESVDALPTQTGQAGEYLQTNGTAASWEPINLTGATEHGFSYINATQTFAASLRALIDTTASALSFNMPASPTLGDTVRCADAAGTMATNYATINGNGNTFTTAAGATDPQFIINTNGADVGFVWNGSTWRIY